MLSVRLLDTREFGEHEELLRTTGVIGEGAMSRQLDSLVDVDVAVAYCGPRPVGCVAVRPQRRDGHLVADLRGGVLVGDRGRGAGGALIDWFCDAGIEELDARVIEVIIDDGVGDDALRHILSERGFVAEDFVEMTAPTHELGGVSLPDGVAVSLLDESDLPLAAAIYGSAHGVRADVDHAERDLLAVWNSPFVSRRESVMAWRDGLPEGFAIAYRWPGDPEDLWIECLSVGPGDGDGGARVARALLNLLRSTRDGTRSVSTGVTAAKSVEYERSGFEVQRRWARFRQVFVAG